MKKLYSCAIAAVAAFATFCPSAANAVPANIPDGWEYVGKGSFTDDMVANFLMFGSLTYDVEFIRNTETPALYRIVAPYGKAYADAFQSEFGMTLKDTEYDVDGSHYLEFDISDPADVKMPNFHTGCSWGYGPIQVGVITGQKLTLADGVITAPTNGVGYLDDSGFYYANQLGEFKIVLPKEESNIPDGWEYAGKGSFTDDMVANFLMFGSLTYDVEFIRNTETPALYRIVAPYGKAYADAFQSEFGMTLKDTEYDVDGSHYLEFDISDPADVKMPNFHTGCSWGYGPIQVGVITGQKLTLADGVITAPTNGVGYLDDSGFYYANQLGEFKIALPSSSGIGTIVTPDENADVEYYNLQGCRIERPAPGTICIRKTGAKVQKIVIR